MRSPVTLRALLSAALALPAVLFPAVAAAQAPPPASDAVPAENTDVSDLAPPREGQTAPEASHRRLTLLSRMVADFEKKTGVKFGVAYTTLFQQASGGPGTRQAAGGDVDFTIKWTAVGRDTKDTGQLVMNAEYRHEMGAITPSQLAGEIGALNGTTNGMNLRPIIVKELYWIQRLKGDTLRIAAGRVDPDGVFVGHALQSANTSFLNKAFSTSPSVPLPGSGAMAGARLFPNGRFTGMFGAINARAVTTQSTIDELFDHGDLLTMGEFGWQPKVEGAGQGRYRVAAWHVPSLDTKPEDWGITLIAEQDVGKHVSTFGRAGWADQGTASLKEYVEAGAGFKDLGGRQGDLLGVALAWTSAADESLRDEKVGEVFQRFNFGTNLSFTVSAQLISDPARAPDDDSLAVFSTRLRFWF